MITAGIIISVYLALSIIASLALGAAIKRGKGGRW